MPGICCFFKAPNHGGHDVALALAGLVLAELLLQVGGMLSVQLGEGRCRLPAPPRAQRDRGGTP